MIIFGSNSAMVHRETIPETCPHCLNVNTVEMNVLQKYAHFFWIPFFPIGKTGMSICSHCKKVMKLREMPDTYKMAFQNAKLQARTPVWTFSGLLLTALIAGWVAYTITQNEKRMAEWISAPQKGDLYTVKTEEKRYMLYKVNDVRDDTVFVLHSRVDAGKSKYTRYILKRGDSAFYREENAVLKSDLQKMLEDGRIMGVRRD